MTALLQPTWTVRGGRVFTPAPFGIMGVVNVTPDSFSDGGCHGTPDAATAHALRLLGEGAHILDIGGESTRPGAAPPTPQDEASRILPVVAGVLAVAPQALISVDTYRAATAAAALKAGAHIINDVSACAWDSGLIEVLAAHRPGYVLMHSQGTPQTMQHNPQYADVVDEVTAFLEQGMARLVRAGLPEGHIVLDPGIGFGKRVEHTFSLLRGIGRILSLGRPVCVGVSRKAFLGQTCAEASPRARDAATHAAVALLAQAGVHLHRVHDVAGAAQALAVARAWCA